MNQQLPFFVGADSEKVHTPDKHHYKKEDLFKDRVITITDPSYCFHHIWMIFIKKKTHTCERDTIEEMKGKISLF